VSEPIPRCADAIVITCDGLDAGAVCAIARRDAPVRVAGEALDRMSTTSEIVLRAAESGAAVYGVTTGLGARANEPVHDAAGALYSLRTIRGRATAVGEPLGRDLTRAAMAVRLAGLCSGGAGAQPAVAESLAGLLNHGVHPRIPRSGSVGAADLCLMAHVALGLIGEGEAELGGEWCDAASALERAGLAPLALGPRDGLAICSSSAVSVGAAALALIDARACLDAAQVAVALSMEGFAANLSPLDARVVAARPAPGQAWASDGLRALLAGGGLTDVGPAHPARRLQDPLSFRCVGQLHGALRTALRWLSDALVPELTGAADNPLVLADEADVIATGNFQVSALALALDAVSISLAQVADAIAERVSRLTEPRMSGLPGNLVDPELGASQTRSGVSPLTKTAHALLAEIRHRAAPLSIQSGILADGVEDACTGAVQSALRLGEQHERLELLIAVELLVGAQAVDVAAVTRPDRAVGRLGVGTAAAYRAVRELVAPVGEDRPLGPEVERLAVELVRGGRLAARARAGGVEESRV
jgi:histidine ammonia-lyase